MTEALPPAPPECLPPKEPYELNEDGTAKDPLAFREALRADPVKMEALEKEPDVAAIVLGDDIPSFQELLKSVVDVGPELQARPGPGGAMKPTGHRRRRLHQTPAAAAAAAQADRKRQEKYEQSLSERTIDAQRVSGEATTGACCPSLR